MAIVQVASASEIIIIMYDPLFGTQSTTTV
jgi:hypothetical protein